MARRNDSRLPFLFHDLLLLAVSLCPTVLGFAAPPWMSKSTLACRTPLREWTRLPLNLRTSGCIVNHQCAKRTRETHARRASRDAGPEKDDAQQNPGDGKSEQKALSPLAMAAADWLDDEEDEISKYWEKFDDAKRGDRAKNDVSRTASEAEEAPGAKSGATTEELLDNYYESRGINKAAEREHQGEIEGAVQEARAAESAEEAVRILEKVRPYLQQNTKLGGETLLELAECYEAKGESERADEIYGSLQSNPHTDIKRRVRQIVLNPASRPKRRFQKGLWNMFSWERWN